VSDAILLLLGRGCSAETFARAAEQRGYSRLEVASCASDAVRAVADGPAVAVFPIDAERVGGLRIERALRAANPSVALVGFGPVVRASVLRRLAQAGVGTYLDEPLELHEIASELPSLERALGPIQRAARAAVGSCDLLETLRLVRFTMCDEALSRVKGSRRGASRLLGVDRRAVQKLIDQMREMEGYDLRALSERRPPKNVTGVDGLVSKMASASPLTWRDVSTPAWHHEELAECHPDGP
jgi:ActR/RegA family two-component response regulator